MNNMTEFFCLVPEQVDILHIGLSRLFRQYHQFSPNQTKTKTRRLFRAGGEITAQQTRTITKLVRKLNLCVSQQMGVKREGQADYSLM